MKSIHFRRMCLLLSLCMLLSLLPFAAFASSDNPDAVTGKAHTSYDYAEIYQAAEIIASGKCGKYVYWKLDKDGVLTIFGSGKTDNYSPILVPEWKPYLEQIKSVVVEDGVTSIGYYMFYFHDITKVSLADSVETLSNGAFYGCDQLTDVSLGSGLKKIDELAFRECVSLKEITISDSVTEICSYAFYNCTALAGITIPDQVTYVGPLAFYGCTALKEVHLGKNVEELGFSAFNGCKSLQYIELPESLEFISEGVFFGCSNLYAVVIPKSITEIRDVAFGNCEKLWHVLYTGTQEQWNQVSVGSDNNYLKDAIRHDLAHGDEIELLQKLQCEEKILYRCTFCDDEVTEPFPGGSHTWTDATCTAPKTCTNCGATKGSVSGSHTFVNSVCTDCGAIEISATTFPDANFHAYITSQSYGADNVLTQEEVQSVTSIDVTWRGISDLTGIQYFTALEYLRCYNNQLTSLDVSRNTALEKLYCYSNQLTDLDVSGLTALYSLNCHSNQLTSLDVSSCTVLEELYCADNQLTSLDVSGCTALGRLHYANNQLTSLDVSKNTALTYLNCDSNQLTSLDVSGLTALTRLNCNYNQLTSLDVSKNNALNYLYCSDNQRTVSVTGNKLDLSTLSADGFDITKASNWVGGTVTGNILTATADTVTYTYDLGNGETETFTLVMDGFCSHNWTDADCENPKTCNRCGATSGEKLPHTTVEDAAVEATCTTTGLTAGAHCVVCGAVLKAQQTVAKKDHTWKAATCSEPKTCTVCGTTSGYTLGHDWAAGNCTTPKICKVCGAKDGGVVHAYEHQYDYKCDLCGTTRIVDMTRPMVDMFRMYNPNTGEHFYTGSTVERDNLISVGWQYEGVGFTFPLTTGKPVHRLFQPSTGEHLYTMDEAEKAKLMAEGWNYEGIAFNSGFENEVPQYRLWNPNATVGAYHFTASQEEKDNLLAAGWIYQGIGWYSLGA